MKQNILNNKLHVFLILMLIILILIPFIVISFYNYYSADDYFYALNRLQRGFLNAQTACYEGINGRYTTTFYLSCLPLSFKIEGGAWVSPIITISLIALSIYYFSSVILKNQIVFYKLLLSFVLIVPFMSLLNNPAESIYWASGTASYGTSIFFFFFFLGNITKFLFYGASNRAFIFSIITLVLLIGSNETMTIVADFILMLLFFYDLFTRKKINFKLILIALIGIGFTIIVIKSPGNVIRLKQGQEMFNYTIKENLKYNSQQILDYMCKLSTNWQNNHILTFCDILLLFILLKLRINENKHYKHFLWLFIPVLFFTFFISLFPIFYTLGVEPPDRVLGIQLILYILCNFYITFLLYHLLNKLLQKIKPNIANLLLILSLLAIIFQVSTTTNNIRKGYYYAFFNPEVKLLYEEMQARLSTIKQSSDKICQVNNLFNRTNLLYRYDLSIDDSSYFANKLLAEYYGKNTIKVKPFKGNTLDFRFYNLESNTSDIISYTIIDTSYSFSSKKSAVMKNNDSYGLTLNISINEIKNFKKINGIEISFKTLSTDTAYKFLTYLFINTKENYSLFNYQKVISSAKNYTEKNWVDHKFIIPIDKREFFHPNNKVVFFFQNNSSHTVYTDDLKIAFIE